jgi:MFS transporter, ACS family, hexuronate transporter
MAQLKSQSTAVFEAVFSQTALAVLVGLLLAETTINYIDRQVVSVLAPTLRAEFHLSNGQYAAIVNAFLVVYAVSYTAAGWALDRLGVGRGLTLSILWWSIADMLAALSQGPFSLAFFRGILGIGEGGSWPAFAKAAAKWAPPEARTLVIGICNSGSSVGSVLAPPLVVAITLRFGWRAAFLITGALGLLWVVAFQIFRYLHPEMARSEAVRETSAAVPWKALLRYRQTWAVFTCRFLADPIWYFFIFWIPEFLTRQRGLTLAGIGDVAWIPFLAAAIGNVAGGYLTFRLERRGWTVNRTRKTLMAIAALLSPVGIFAVYAHSLFWTIAPISIAIFFWVFWSIAVHSLAGDYFPARAVASVYGIAGTGSTIGSAIATWAVGRTLDLTHSYAPVFIGLSMLMPIAMVAGFSLMGRVEMIRDFDE